MERMNGYKLKVNQRICVVLLVVGLSLLTQCIVESSCRMSERELWAYSNPSRENFKDEYKKYLTSDKSEECRWVIIASDKDEVIQLEFPRFALKNSSGSESGDCLEIYDGKSTSAPVLDTICNKLPGKYTSSERSMLVVYKRGEVEGKRRFTMLFSAKDATFSQAKIIRIAGIVGAVLATVGLVYVIIRVTKCCSCIKGKGSSSTNGNTGNPRERDRLTHIVSDENNETTATSSNNQNPSVVVASPNGTTSNDEAHESDTDSLQAMNEPPPSYESLYLNEDGEPITPPRYSPPEHRAGHPPRRVHTFN